MQSLVKDVMTKDVAAVRETAGYKDIIARMRERSISALPVLDAEDHLIGVVSEADLLLKEVGLEALSGGLMSSGRRGERAKAAGVTAADLMTTPAWTIGPGESVAAAARRMHELRVKRLPVVDEAGRLVGIISRVDVLSVFGRPDDEIRDEVAGVAGEFARDPGGIDVTVRCGIVTVTGQVSSHDVAASLIDALKRVEGVVHVRDRISHPPVDQPEAAVFTRTRPPG